jgi:hypothetical protein
MLGRVGRGKFLDDEEVMGIMWIQVAPLGGFVS